MDEYAITALILTAATLLVAGLCSGLRSWSRSGRLSRNQLLGVRTRATLSSDEAWELGHHAAEPSLKVASQLGFGAGAITALLAAWSQTSAGMPSWPTLVLSILGFAGTIAAMLLGSRAADLAAVEVRDALEDLA